MVKLIKNFFSKKELKVIDGYCQNKFYQDKIQIESTNFAASWLDDPLMNSLLNLKLSLVEMKSNLKLFPTYSYWRYYVFGSMLKKHTDRPSCEISITACIKKYDNWPIFVEGKSFEIEEGDAVLYKGCVQKHWRPNIYKGEGMAQVFFHYVDQNGPFTHHMYDNYFKITGNKYSEKDLQIIKKLTNE